MLSHTAHTCNVHSLGLRVASGGLPTFSFLAVLSEIPGAKVPRADPVRGKPLGTRSHGECSLRGSDVCAHTCVHLNDESCAAEFLAVSAIPAWSS